MTERNRFAGPSLGDDVLSIYCWFECSFQFVSAFLGFGLFQLFSLFRRWFFLFVSSFHLIVSEFVSTVLSYVLSLSPFALSHISIAHSSEEDKKKEVRRLHKLGKCNWGTNCHRSHDDSAKESSDAQDEYVVLIPIRALTRVSASSP